MLLSGADDPPKLQFSLGIFTPWNTCFLEPTRLSPQNGISMCWAVFAGSRTWPTDRYTDLLRYSVCSNRPLSLAIVAMRSTNGLRLSVKL